MPNQNTVLQILVSSGINHMLSRKIYNFIQVTFFLKTDFVGSLK